MQAHDMRRAVVYVVDDDPDVRNGLQALFQSVNLPCETFNSAQDFLQAGPKDDVSCLILDVRLQGASGLAFQDELAKANVHIPIIFITGHGDIPMSVKAMKAGAVEFLTKPLREQDLLDAVYAAFERDRAWRELDGRNQESRIRLEALSPREREVMNFVIAGLLNKQIAAKIGLSEETVKVHRHNLMKKLGLRSVPELIRMAEDLGIGRNIVMPR
jgi:FixJ family two-component response regulator